MHSLETLRSYTPFLWAMALIGLVGLNGVFLYGLSQPSLMTSALRNPVSVAFVAEALVLTALGAWALHRIGITQPGWRLFIVASLVGGLAFSIPLFVLLHLRRTPEHPHPATA
ncbi:MAG TPA: hypothetical protein VD948_11630 [Rhodothermales bacterium]|nr:hypothetical protein [Rhodothermales bacterium]